MVAVTIEQVPADALEAKLDGWAERVLTLASAFEAIVADFHGMETRRFRDEGPGWKPLAGPTVAERTRLGYGGAHPILERTGLLKGSLTRSGADHAIVRTSATELFVGTDVPYARWHQEGGSRDGRPPQRVLVTVGERDAGRWMQILGAWIAGTGDLHISSDLGPGA